MGRVSLELLKLGASSATWAIEKLFIYVETLLFLAIRVCMMVISAVETIPCSANGARIVVSALHVRMVSCSTTRARVVFILEIGMMPYSTARARVFLLYNRIVPRSTSWARNVVTTLCVRVLP